MTRIPKVRRLTLTHMLATVSALLVASIAFVGLLKKFVDDGPQQAQFPARLTTPAGLDALDVAERDALEIALAADSVIDPVSRPPSAVAFARFLTTHPVTIPVWDRWPEAPIRSMLRTLRGEGLGGFQPPVLELGPAPWSRLRQIAATMARGGQEEAESVVATSDSPSSLSGVGDVSLSWLLNSVALRSPYRGLDLAAQTAGAGAPSLVGRMTPPELLARIPLLELGVRVRLPEAPQGDPLVLPQFSLPLLELRALLDSTDDIKDYLENLLGGII